MEEYRPDRASPTYVAAHLAIKTAIKLSGGLTSSGVQNIPKETAYVLAYTHHNSWDAPALGSLVYEKIRRPVYFMAKEELLGGAVVGSVLRSMHAIPVSREKSQNLLSQIRHSIALLKSGHILGVAPEGGRVNGDRVAEMQAGVGSIAARASVEVVPVGIAGKNRVMGESQSPYLPRPIHIHFGEPIQPSGDARLDRKRIDRLLQGALQESLDEAYRQYGLIHGEEAAAKLDKGLTKLFD